MQFLRQRVFFGCVLAWILLILSLLLVLDKYKVLFYNKICSFGYKFFEGSKNILGEIMSTFAWSVTAGFIAMCGYIPYLRSIWKKTGEPATSTWIVWLALDIVSFLGMYARDEINGLMVAFNVGAATTLTLSLWTYGFTKWKLLDTVCVSISALGIVLWIFTDNPTVAIALSIFSGLIGSIPTFVSTWIDPTKEDALAWAMFCVACIPGLLAVSEWDFDKYAAPVLAMIIETVMVFLIFVKPKIISKK